MGAGRAPAGQAITAIFFVKRRQKGFPFYPSRGPGSCFLSVSLRGGLLRQGCCDLSELLYAAIAGHQATGLMGRHEQGKSESQQPGPKGAPTFAN